MDSPLTLHRLEQDCCRAFRGDSSHRIEIVEGNDVKPRHQWHEQLLVVVLAVGGEAEALVAVVPHAHGDHVVSARGAPGELDRARTRIAACGAEHHLVEIARAERGELACKPDLGLGEQVARPHVPLIQGLFKRLHDLRVAPAHVEAPCGAEAVEELPACHRVDYRAPLPAAFVNVQVGASQIPDLPPGDVLSEEVVDVVPLRDVHGLELPAFHITLLVSA